MTTFDLRHRSTTTTWLQWESVVGLTVLAAMGAVVVTGQPGAIGADMQEAVRSAFRYMFTSPVSLVLIAGVFALEWFLPARPEQRGFGPSVVFDALYLVLHRPMAIVLVAAATQPLRDLLADHAGFLVVDRSSEIPMLVLLVLGVAIGDLVLWFSHMVRHRAHEPRPTPVHPRDAAVASDPPLQRAGALELQLREHLLLGPPLRHAAPGRSDVPDDRRQRPGLPRTVELRADGVRPLLRPADGLPVRHRSRAAGHTRIAARGAGPGRRRCFWTHTLGNRSGLTR